MASYLVARAVIRSPWSGVSVGMHETLRRAIDDLRYPWPAAAERDVSAIEARTLQWSRDVARFGSDEIRRLQRVAVTRLAAITDPWADEQTLELVARTMAWIFVEDDRHDDGGTVPGSTARLRRRIMGYVATLQDPRITRSDPTTHALAELARSLATHASADWYAGWAACMRRFWVNGLLVEQRFRERGATPDVAAYAGLRVHTVGIEPCLAFAELSPGGAIGSLRDDVRAHRLARLTSWIVACANDVCSYAKEQAAGDRHNLVAVLCEHRGLSLSAAVDEVIRMHDETLADYLALEASLYDEPGFARRVAACRSWMTGALQWQRTAARYAVAHAA